MSSSGIVMHGKSHDDKDNENVKKQLVLWAKQQLCTCITLISSFLWRQLHNSTWNHEMRRFIVIQDVLQAYDDEFFRTWIKSLRTPLQADRLHLTIEAGPNRRDRIWKDADSFF